MSVSEPPRIAPRQSGPVSARLPACVAKRTSAYDVAMQAYGTDRCRVRGEQVVLLSSTVKPWQPRVPATLTSVAHPGTAVDWDGAWFEVVAAHRLEGGRIRYELAPWRDENAMRHVVRYDDESERVVIADAERARRQRKGSVAARFASVLLGHLPTPVQDHLGLTLGLRPSRMTLVSTIPGAALFGYAVWRFAGAVIGQDRPIAPALFYLGAVLFLDSLVRFLVAMSSDRGLGSVIGVPSYVLLWALAPARWALPSPFGGAGHSIRTLKPSADVAHADSVTLRAPLITLLSAEDQARIAESSGLRVDSYAQPTAWLVLICAGAGAVSMLMKLAEFRLSVLLSLALALVMVVDQLSRIPRLSRGPAPSLLAPLLRRFARDLLEWQRPSDGVGDAEESGPATEAGRPVAGG